MFVSCNRTVYIRNTMAAKSQWTLTQASDSPQDTGTLRTRSAQTQAFGDPKP